MTHPGAVNPASSAGPPSARPAWLSAPRIVLALLCTIYFILYIDRVNISIAAPLIKSDLKLSNTQLGLIFSAFAVPYALFQLIGGWIGDKLGARLTLSLCCAVVASATMLTGAAGGFASLFVLRIALGFGEGSAFPTGTRAIASWMPKSQWGFAQGITHSFARMGNAVTPTLIAALLVWVSWRGSFLIAGIPSLLWLFVWAWYFRNDPREHPSITAAEVSALPSPPAGGRVEVPWFRLMRRILPLTVVDFCYGWTLWLFLSWIPAFFFENYHQKLQASALFSSGVFFAGVVGDTAGGIISDRLLRKTGSLLVARRSVMVMGFVGAFLFLIPVILNPQSQCRRGMPVICFLFRGTHRGPSLVDAHGYRPEIRRLRQRHDEFRLWHCGHRFAIQFRLPCRSNGELGSPLYRLSCASAFWRRMRLAPAA